LPGGYVDKHFHLWIIFFIYI